MTSTTTGKMESTRPQVRQAWEEGAAGLDFQNAIVGARLVAGLSQRQLADSKLAPLASVSRQLPEFQPLWETDKIPPLSNYVARRLVVAL